MNGKRKDLCIGLIGSFYPQVLKAGSSTTGLALLLSELPGVRQVVVLGPKGSAAPRFLNTPRLRIEPIWDFDRPLSLVRCMLLLLLRRKEFDLYVFNVILRTYGDRSVANGLGLLLPTVLAWGTPAPVIVYAHSLLETQDNASLGFTPGWASRRLIRALEGVLVRSARVVVPMPVQKERLRAALGVRVDQIFIPFFDALSGYLSYAADGAPKGRTVPRDGTSRVLLFGTWSPHKDFSAVLRVATTLVSTGLRFHLTVAGRPMPDFPRVPLQIREGAGSLPPDAVRIIENVGDEEVPRVFLESDILILPYLSSGGYSGVMNLGTFYGLTMIAYDLPEIRECASILGVRCIFVPRGDESALGRALRDAILSHDPSANVATRDPAFQVGRARTAVAELVDLALSGSSQVVPSAQASRRLDPDSR